MTRVVRWGILGTGAIAKAFADTVREMPDAEVVAVASGTPGRAAAFARVNGIERAHAGDDDLVSDDTVDAVYVASTNDRHAPQTLTAIAAGTPVLCEKPFALDADQAETVAAAARGAGVFCMEAMWSRFLPWADRLNEIVESGRLGPIRLVAADLGFPLPDDPKDRLLDPGRGGGSLLDVGIYPVTLARMVLGSPNAIRALAMTGGHGVDEQTVMTLGYESGAVADLRSSFRTFSPNEATVAGPTGYLRLHDQFHQAKTMTLHLRNAESEVIDCSFTGSGYQFEIAEVHRCLTEGRTESAVMPLDETIEVLRILDLIRAEIGLFYPGRPEPR